MYARRQALSILRTDGSHYLFTRSSANSPIYGIRLKGWNHLWSTSSFHWPKTLLTDLYGASCYSLEDALQSKEPNNIVTQVLGQFIVNLKPQTRNLR